MNESEMTVSNSVEGGDMKGTMVIQEPEIDLEEGECSDDEVPEEEPEQQIEPVTEPVKEMSKEKEERKEKKHKRRSRSGSRDRHRSRKHKKKKGKDKDKEKEREEEEVDDETAKKRAMMKRLKALEGVMGLVESEPEEGRSAESRSPSPGSLREKRKRDPNEQDPGRKKWKGPKSRYCNLYLQGKCPRDAEDCMFSHDFDVPKVFELCKFYVYDRCVKKDKCLYLHKEFPCKFYHLGIDLEHSDEACKFSHQPLNDLSRNLLLKHVETAPKELLGDFPRLSRHEAVTHILNTEAKLKDWNLSDRTPGSRWDRTTESPVPLNKEGRVAEFDGFQSLPGHDIQGRDPFNPLPPTWRGGGGGTMGILGSPPKSKPSKPAGLMEIKLNENVIRKFLSNQRMKSENKSDGSDQEREAPWEREPGGEGGDETPEITPPVSPAQDCEDSEYPEMPKTQLKLYQRIQQKVKKESTVSETKDWEPKQDYYYSDDEKDSSLLKNVLSNLRSEKSESPESQGTSLPLELTSMLNSIGKNSPKTGNISPTFNSPVSHKDEKKDPRTGKVDPRKARQARKEEEERLEREKDQRILDLDLGSVFEDLDLPMLNMSPKQTEEEKYLSDKLGLPFKPHIYNVAKEIDASINSHPPIDWNLVSVDVLPRDYSNIKHHFSASQIELDPRLRRFGKSGIAKMKDLPLPNMPAPKSDPRLKGKTDPRRPPNTETRRRSNEDSDGNHVYNPARELNKERSVPENPGFGRQNSGYMEQQQPIDETFSPGMDYSEENYPGAQDQYENQEYFQNQDQLNPNMPMDYDESGEPMNSGFPGNQEMTFEQMQFSMGMLKGIQQNMEAMLHQGPGRDPRMRPGFNPNRFPGFHNRGFPPGGPGRGQWNPRFGRGDLRGHPGGRGGLNTLCTRDPRVK